MISDHLYVFAELTGDSVPELIAGSFDETFKSNNPIFKKGNKKRSRNKHQYYFYSKSKNFERPKGTKFSLATAMLVNDYNEDKKDDVFFVQHGPDYAPKIPQKNEIMLSIDGGFKVDYVPGPKSLWGGGRAGISIVMEISTLSLLRVLIMEFGCMKTWVKGFLNPREF